MASTRNGVVGEILCYKGNKYEVMDGKSMETICDKCCLKYKTVDCVGFEVDTGVDCGSYGKEVFLKDVGESCMNIDIFKDELESKIEDLEELILNNMKNSGDTCEESQKICFMLSIGELHSLVNGTQENDLIN